MWLPRDWLMDDSFVCLDGDLVVDGRVLMPPFALVSTECAYSSERLDGPLALVAGRGFFDILGPRSPLTTPARRLFRAGREIDRMLVHGFLRAKGVCFGPLPGIVYSEI